VHRGLQARRARAAEEALVARGVLHPQLEVHALGAGEVDAEHAAPLILDGLVEDDLVLLVGELAGEAEEQAAAHPVLELRLLHAADGGVDDVVEIALAPEVSFHRVEAELDQVDAAGAVLLADDLVDAALDGVGGALNLLRPLVHDREVVLEGLHLVAARGEQVDELPVVPGRQLEALLHRDAVEDVRRDRAADVDVQVGQKLRQPRVQVLANAHASSVAGGSTAPTGPPQAPGSTGFVEA
jgi:hypothetical protein